jgi:hypothetical protein
VTLFVPGKKSWRAALGLLLAALLNAQDVAPGRQTEPPKKQANDYMSSVMLRNTNQLGLKEDPALTRLLKQPSVDWAIRASTRHILN